MTGISRRGLIHGANAAALGAVLVPAAAPGATPGAYLRLNQNENPYGPSDAAKKAMQEALDLGWAYAQDDAAQLRRMIAAKEGLKPENVFICEGSTELLRIGALAFTSNGKELVAGLPTFNAMPQYTARVGGKVQFVQLDSGHRLDLDAMASRVGANTGAVFICNPNNPTGTIVETARLKAFIESISPKALVLIDEAYIDLVDDPAATTLVEQVKQGRNVLVSRTFSKLHGLAGLRVGYGLGQPAVIRRLEDLRTSIPNRLGLRAALASYQDTAFLDYSRKMVRAAVATTSDALTKMKVKFQPTQANFLILDTGGSSVAFATFMRDKGILTTPQFDPIANWCRVSMGRVEQMETFLAAAREFFQKT